jgi:hypothetical protein
MVRSALDDAATRLCRLADEAANADRIAQLIWQAHDAAAAGDLDASHALLAAARDELDAAEREVGVVAVRLEVRVLPKFDDGRGAFLRLKRPGGGA